MSNCNEESQFELLDNKLQEIVIEFLNDDRLTKLLYYNTKDALSQPSVENPYDLNDTKIYRFPFKPPVDEEITMLYVFFPSFDGVPGNPYLKKGVLEVGVCTHRNLWTIDSGTRLGKIMASIDNIINKNYFSGGLSKEFFRKARYYPFSDTHSGYIIEYSGIDAQ